MRNTRKILIIEDNPFNHDLYRAAFTAAGFDVDIREGADAHFIETVLAISPDIISMDLMIKEGGEGVPEDGFGVLALLKSDERTRSIPVVVLTSFFEESKVVRARELGAVDFIALPGQSMQKIADRYQEYLRDPKHYHPTHPLFHTA